jgi:cell division protein FtsL
MAKSRKSPASILRFGPLMLAVGLCGPVAVSAIGYVWHRNRNEQLVRENALTRRRLEAQQKENQELEYRFLGLTRPEGLTERARVLGLDRPDPDQFIRVELPPMGSLAAPARTSVSLAVRSPQP